MSNLCPISSETVIIPPGHTLIASVTKVQYAFILLRKFRSINRKTPVLESLFNKVAGMQIY